MRYSRCIYERDEKGRSTIFLLQMQNLCFGRRGAFREQLFERHRSMESATKKRIYGLFMKLRLDRVLQESYEADSLEEALACTPASLEFVKPEKWTAPYPKYESGWWEPFLHPGSQTPKQLTVPTPLLPPAVSSDPPAAMLPPSPAPTPPMLHPIESNAPPTLPPVQQIQQPVECLASRKQHRACQPIPRPYWLLLIVFDMK
ncbi:hypothetical protein RND71_030956 [Anisodus tanguticus]|uniref:Uncharacterized protein n=1 Tax=Anisodus tanguticus TaxID=243964 RepID=A0AAE1RHC7_9SOLA|nr:hypothetical protein RND71_030956 [Anisodus tanguticus]